MLLLFTLSLTVAAGISASAQTGSGTPFISGGVIARQTGQPVPGATVSIEGGSATTTTNAVGRFRLDNLTAGVVVLMVKAPGFLDLRIPDVQASANGPALTIELDVTPNFLDRVQVTASKEPLSIGEVAAQADIIDKATIESRNDQTVVQAVSHVPGAVINSTLGVFDNVMLRGMPSGGEFSRTLLLIDGIPQTTSRHQSRLTALTINDASNIEVVRGPNSALYGRTAIGGSINLLTADPTPTHQFSVDFTGGQFGMTRGVARASGPISERAGYYVSVSKDRSTGYFDTKTGGDYVNDTSALFGKVTFVPDDKSLLGVSINRVVSDNSTPTNEPIIDGQLLHVLEPRFTRFTNFNIPGPNYRQPETRLAVNYSRQVTNRLKLVEVFGFRDLKYEFDKDGDFLSTPFDLATHTIEMYPFSQQLNEKIFYQEVRGEITPKLGSIRNSLVVGMSYDRSSGTINTDFLFTDAENEGIPIDFLNPAIPPESEWQHDVQPRRTYHIGNLGVFTQYTIEPMPRWVFMAGGRYDRMSLDNVTEGSAKVAETFDAFSPKASATFKLLGLEEGVATTVNLYGAYSRAFLPPRAPSSLTPANITQRLVPETINNVEGGLKGTALSGRVNFEGTYFWMKEDGVVLTRNQGPFFFPTNAGIQRYKGFETGVGVKVTPMISTYFNAAFYRSRFGEFVIESEDGDTVLTGNRLPGAPDSIFNWGVSVDPRRDVNATLNLKRVGAVEADQDNTFTIGAYTLVDAAITYRRGPARFTLSGRNLFDTEYYSQSDGDTADPGRPRQVLFTVSVGLK